ncbi:MULTISPECIES: PP2C family serine/threonine-protein phosphatase [unclassified Streptomyces]|uniref:PP2C family serine/threonine-protein phosphatase n=1 Tax=unclassified Streptomyces TaxID=2593676 RepID=UPI0004C4F194|nr:MULTISPECIES: PP2C family serine/threonine-protein phosphatase [unclassified Streptomyces]KOV93226.1 serine/threonine protein phosphatase [Streptomyces sp. NRRL WC-3723]
MSQMPQQAALAKCPSCAEPVEPGDLFCGACGYDLSSVPAPPQDHPTLTMTGPAGPGDGTAWPTPEPPGPTASPAPHLPTDLPGTDSGGTPLSGEGSGPASAAAPPPGQEFGPAAGGGPSAAGEGGSGPGGTPPPHGNGPVPGGAQPGGQEADAEHSSGSGVRFDRPDEPDEYPLQAPDPRLASAPADPAQLCVACRAGRVDSDGYCENCGHAQPRERDHVERESGPVAAVSDRGLRHHRNEDAFAVGHTTLPDGTPAALAIVCDGVSSATRPDDASLAASQAAGDTLLTALPRGTHPQAAMHEAIVAAAQAVNALAEEPATAREHAPHQNAPACTIVGAVVTPGLLVVGWVGDSRVYWVPTDRTAPPARLTEDDSWAAQMVAAGLMSEAEAYADARAHAITGWLGADAYELEPHTASFKPDRPGAVVVCTDGLWNYAETAEEMSEVVPPDAADRPLHSARVLVGHALDGGGHDNVTVAVLPFPVPSQGAGSA